MKLGQIIKVFDRKAGKIGHETITVIDSVAGANCKTLTTEEHKKLRHFSDADEKAPLFWMGSWEKAPRGWKQVKPAKKTAKPKKE